jgi:hypothetical protein
MAGAKAAIRRAIDVALTAIEARRWLLAQLPLAARAIARPQLPNRSINP